MVIKIGGSLLYSSDFEINKPFFDVLKKWFDNNRQKHEKLVLVTGGGKLSRKIGEIIKNISSDEKNLHAVAMEATQISSYIVQSYLEASEAFVPQKLGDAYEYLVEDTNSLLMIAGGLKHGWSTDMDAAAFADILKERKVYKLTDVEGIYTADPKVDSNAQLIKDISWEDFKNTFGISDNSHHEPNQHVPVSVESALFCENKGVTMYIAGGKNIYEMESLEDVFESGTKIHP